MQIDPAAVMAQLTTIATTWGLKVLGAVAVLIIGRMICAALRRAARRGLERSEVDASLVPFLSNLVYYFALTVVLVAVLNIFGIQTASIIAVLGAAGLAIGLALQGSLSNFAAGVMLLAFRPFKVGDYVELTGANGSIHEIGIFFTILHTPDNVRVVVPNSTVFGDVVKNYSANENRRNDLVVGISYGDDIGKALSTIQSVVTADPRVLKDPEPMFAVAELGDSSVNIVVRPWCAGSDYWPLRFDLTRKLKEELEAAGCSIPFPQQDVHHHGVPPAA